MDTQNFIVYMKTNDICKDIAEGVEIRFGTWIYELGRPLRKWKSKTVIVWMRDELDWKIMTNIAELRIKTCSYLRDDVWEDKKTKVTKKCVIKRKLKFQNYKNWLGATQLENIIK